MSPAQQTLLSTNLRAKVEASALAQALKLVLPFAHGELTVYHGVRIRVDAGTMTLEATNGDQKVSTSLAVAVQNEGEVVVGAKVLDGFVRSLTGAVELKVTDGVDLTVECGSATLDLRLIEQVEWPLFAEPSSDEVDLTAVWPHVRRTFWAEGQADNKSAPTHCMHFGDEAITVCCDRGLATYAVPGLKRVANVPLAFLQVLTKLIDPKDGVHAHLEERLVMIRSGATTWMSRTVTDEYPNWQRLFREEPGDTLTIGKADLLSTLTRSGLLPEDSGFRRVTLQRAGDDLVVTATGPDVGTITDVIPCSGTYNADELRLGIDRLKKLASDLEGDEVTLRIVDAWHHFEIHEGDYRALLMPLRPDRPQGPPPIPTATKANPEGK